MNDDGNDEQLVYGDDDAGYLSPAFGIGLLLGLLVEAVLGE